MKRVYFDGGPLDGVLRPLDSGDPTRIVIGVPSEEPEPVTLDGPLRKEFKYRNRLALYHLLRFGRGYRAFYNEEHPAARQAEMVVRFHRWDDEPDTPKKIE